MTFEEIEAGLRPRLEALPPAARAELLHVLRIPDFHTVPIGSASSGNTGDAPSPNSLIDCEEDGTLRTVLVGMLRENYRPDSDDADPLRIRVKTKPASRMTTEEGVHRQQESTLRRTRCVPLFRHS